MQQEVSFSEIYNYFNSSLKWNSAIFDNTFFDIFCAYEAAYYGLEFILTTTIMWVSGSESDEEVESFFLLWSVGLVKRV